MALKQRRRILVLIDWFYPGFRSGGPARSWYNLIDHFSSEADFYVITRNVDYHVEEPYEGIVSNDWNQIREALNVYYISPDQLNRKNIVNAIKSAGDVDLCFLNGIFSYYFTILPLLYLKGRLKVIVSIRGMLSKEALRIKSSKKKLFLSIAKSLNLFSKVSFHVTSNSERDDLKKYFKNCNVLVAPNMPRRIANGKPLVHAKQEGELKLIYLARISSEKNLLFVLESLKQVISGIVSLDIYGSIADEVYWDRCQELIKILPENVTVSYKGNLAAEDVSEALKAYHFLVLPSISENFGHSIIESLSSAVPVIIGPNTPWVDIQEKGAGYKVPIDDPQELANVIDQCIYLNREVFEKYSEAAYYYAKKYASSNDLIDANRKLLGLA